MAQQLKSAGDGATPGSAAQTGTSSLDQAHDVRAAGASPFVGFSLSLGNATLQAKELAALLDTVCGIVDGELQDVERAELLAGLAHRRLVEFCDYLSGLEEDFCKLPQGVRHG